MACEPAMSATALLDRLNNRHPFTIFELIIFLSLRLLACLPRVLRVLATLFVLSDPAGSPAKTGEPAGTFSG